MSFVPSLIGCQLVVVEMSTLIMEMRGLLKSIELSHGGEPFCIWEKIFCYDIREYIVAHGNEHIDIRVGFLSF